jgi:eukaryotic-like serine/threonine-protein kinase
MSPFESMDATRVVFRDVDDAELRRLDAAATPEGSAVSSAVSSAEPVRIGEFTLLRRIGGGGMGTVYEARQERPERSVALKVMRHGLGSKSLRTRFEREADVLARLSHRNIAQVYAVGTSHSRGGNAALLHAEGPAPFIALELVRGAAAITNYATERRLGRADRVRLFVQACDAIEHAHAARVLHRDLKPDNILVDADGVVKVIDFGVARFVRESGEIDSAHAMLTEYGQLLGTVQYMSPEQCAADPAQIDDRSDVYSLGVILYELCVGELPYDVRQLPIHEAVRVAQTAAAPRAASRDVTIDPDLDVVLAKAIAKAREDRYASVAEFGADLRRWLAGEPIAARPPSRVRSFFRLARRNRIALALGIALFMVVAASAGAISALGERIAYERAARLAAERAIGGGQGIVAIRIGLSDGAPQFVAADEDETPHCE